MTYDMPMQLKAALWQGPYHPTWHAICPGDWVMWVMPHFVKVGQVEYREGISIVIKFQGDLEPTVLPDGYMYWDPMPPTPAPEYTLHPTHEPKHRVEAAVGPEMTVRQAAAKLGTTPKDVRRMLRSGQLRGRREDGKWVAVDAVSLSARRADGQPSTA